MTYTISREQLAAITDIETAFGTTKYLPDENDIPQEFKNGNVYTRLCDAIFAGTQYPDCEVVFADGFSDIDAPVDLKRCVRAHIRSFDPKHQHKIAGVGFLISLVCELRNEK